jgi:hypothetical protein
MLLISLRRTVQKTLSSYLLLTDYPNLIFTTAQHLTFGTPAMPTKKPSPIAAKPEFQKLTIAELQTPLMYYTTKISHMSVIAQTDEYKEFVRLKNAYARSLKTNPKPPHPFKLQHFIEIVAFQYAKVESEGIKPTVQMIPR